MIACTTTPSRDFDPLELARKRQSTWVAWRILKDWIEVQLALLDTGMVELEEISLPYLLQGDQTLYHALREGKFRAL